MIESLIRTPQRYKLETEKGPFYLQLLGVEPDSPPFPEITLTEAEADAIMLWCTEHQCGVRTSFNMWRFKNGQDMMAFILKWC